MASTIAQITERTFREVARASSQEAAHLYLTDIESWIPTACRMLAEMALERPSESSAYLFKTYTLTADSGVFRLTTATDMLYESLRRATVTHADSTRPFVYLPDPQDLYYPQSSVLYHFALDRDATGRIIRTQDTNGLVDNLTSDLTIRNAIFVPVVATLAASTTLPEQLETALIAILKDMATAKMAAGATA